MSPSGHDESPELRIFPPPGAAYVTWRELHLELAARDDAHQKREDEREERQQARDDRMIGTLEEIRDSLGGMHTRFEVLDCQRHDKRLLSVEAALARYNDGAAVVKLLAGWINRKTVIPILAVGAGVAGWTPIRDLLDKLK